MSNKSGIASNIISLPKGGGAQKGMGETFSPDLFTGTGNFSVPIAVLPGRNGFQPELSLGYSTGSGNSPFGQGWNLSVPGIVRKTAKGIPTYDDELDTFILSGAEDLVPVHQEQTSSNGIEYIRTQYRPRTEGLFARIEHHVKNTGENYWEVKSKDGLTSFYGEEGSVSGDKSKIVDSSNLKKVFAWKLTRTVDVFGNDIVYTYDQDLVQGKKRNWCNNYLSSISYINYQDSGNTEYLAKVKFEYKEREDVFSDFSPSFESRTTKRCVSIASYSYPGKVETLSKKYLFTFLDELVTSGKANMSSLPLNGSSTLKEIQVVGYDGNDIESMPPLEFEYTQFNPEKRKFELVKGQQLPPQSLANPEYELVDIFGNGLPDIVHLNGSIARFWRNMGGGEFASPKFFKNAPAGLSLADPDVQMIDAQGDGKIDLQVTKPNIGGFFPMQHTGEWDESSFEKYKVLPSFSFGDSEVKMLDLTGDGVTDVLRNGANFECFYNIPELGFGKTRVVKKDSLDRFPNVSFTDPRIKLGSVSGGLQDILFIQNGSVSYWPNLGYGDFGPKIIMKNSPKFNYGFDPKRLLVGDVDGDGLADMVYVENNKVTLWINQSGNGWSDPIEVLGTPPVSDMDSVRIVDLYGSGVAGVLWTRDAQSANPRNMSFLDFSGGVKPYLMEEVNNNMGAITRTKYISSIEFYLKDQLKPETSWQTTLPFPTLCLAKTEVIDEISKGKLVTNYAYHHGYWDGGEREFRGFGRVEQYDTERFADYNNSSLKEVRNHKNVAFKFFSPPIETIHWFHLGPVGPEKGDWFEANFEAEYWQGDKPMLKRSSQFSVFLNKLPRRARRDAIRTLRGSTLRTELYGRDGSALQHLPFTVSESIQEAGEVYHYTKAGNDTHAIRYDQNYLGQVNNIDIRNRKIFFSFSEGQRTTNWERGTEPMHKFSFNGDYDNYGQSRLSGSIAVPRGINPLSGGREAYLVSFSKTRFIDDSSKYLKDRVCETKQYEQTLEKSRSVFDVWDRIVNGSGTSRVIGHQVIYYDGNAYTGGAFNTIGSYGVPVRTEQLVMLDSTVLDVYAGTPTPLQNSPTWPTHYPTDYKTDTPNRAGFLVKTANSSPSSPLYEDGYYVEAERKQYDFQVVSSSDLGLVTGVKDPFGNIATVVFDLYLLMPLTVTDPAGNVTTAEHDYRIFQADLVTDANDNQKAFGFSPLGLMKSTSVMGKSTESKGDTLLNPSVKLEYDFLSYYNSQDPVWVKTIQMEEHYNDNSSSDSIVSVEFSDGFGRLLQTRTQAEDVLFGLGQAQKLGDSGLPANQGASNQNAVGIENTNADNVVVSGYKRYNNKGKVVEQYEPFFDTGFTYKAN